MTPSEFDSITRLEAELWSAADNLRANSKLTSSEYCMPVLGIIFLRHASNRYDSALKQIQDAQASGEMPKRKLVKADFIKRRALMLPKEARYHHLMALSKSENLGSALVEAMNAIERDFEPLAGQLPKDYEKFDHDLLESILRTFDSQPLRAATGDVFGRIYEYFLMKFAMQGAQDNGEFFTPPSLVQLIVNVIEPDHGVVADLACGSGGMFVQSSHFIEDHGGRTMDKVTFYGQEKTATTIRLAKMNLAVHGLEGDIREANTFYEDVHRLQDGRPLWGNCDFIMANPPFNVDMVDATKIKDDRRLPFGLPGQNKEKKVSNGNYLWISYFHSYLGKTGRAGFVMSSQASSAGHGEAEVRRKLVETGDVDVMISIRSNFFYTRTVPCELWHFDKGKPPERKDQVLMLDARHVFRKVTRKIYDFTPEQQQNLAAIVWLYRGETERYQQLLGSYDDQWRQYRRSLDALLPELLRLSSTFPSAYKKAYHHLKEGVAIEPFVELVHPLADASRPVIEWAEGLVKAHVQRDHSQHETRQAYLADAAAFRREIHEFLKQANAAGSAVRPYLERPTRNEFDPALSELQQAADESLKLLAGATYWIRQIEWLLHRFPEGRYADVPGLCKLVRRADIAAADWSLTPGRYVGVAAAEVDEDFDFAQAMKDIHVELADLNQEATALAATIQENFEGLGV